MSASLLWIPLLLAVISVNLASPLPSHLCFLHIPNPVTQTFHCPDNPNITVTLLYRNISATEGKNLHVQDTLLEPSQDISLEDTHLTEQFMGKHHVDIIASV